VIDLIHNSKVLKSKISLIFILVNKKLESINQDSKKKKRE